MKIVVLDGYTLNPGDLSWKDLQSLGDCDIYDRTPPDQTLPRAQDAEIILTNKTILDRDIIAGLSSLRYIGVLATGYNVVDAEAAAERGIPVTNVPGYGTSSVCMYVNSVEGWADLGMVLVNKKGVKKPPWSGLWGITPLFGLQNTEVLHLITFVRTLPTGE